MNPNFKLPNGGIVILILTILNFGNATIIKAQQINYRRDSLVLVDLYNATNGANWINNSGWLSRAPYRSWYGVRADHLGVGNLKLSNNNLTGFIPPSLFNLLHADVIDLSNNQISGTIPSNIDTSVPRSALYYLRLNNNRLTGTIPYQFLAMYAQYMQCFLDNNLLNGPFPRNHHVLTGGYYISNNYFNFDDWEKLFGPLYNISGNNPFSPQKAKIHKHNNYLTIYVGGNLSHNTYNWTFVGPGYYPGSVIKGDSTFHPVIEGKYSVKVSSISAAGVVIYSDTIDFVPTPIELPCSLTYTDLLSVTTPRVVSLNSAIGAVQSQIKLNTGAFVFVSTKGKIKIGTYKSPNGIVKDIVIPPDGNDALPSIMPSSKKLNKNFRFGQLLAVVDKDTFDFESFSMQGLDCKNMLDENFIKITYFRNEFTNYFILKNSGNLKFLINETNYADNSGSYNIEIYTISETQHTNRNCFNSCPKRIPIDAGDGNWLDVESNIWGNYTFITHTVDELIEECYHCGKADFRGMKNLKRNLQGCQCVYESNGNLDNTISTVNCMGTFDYAYWKEPSNRRLHYILDIFPHQLFKLNTKFRYAPIPIDRIF